MKPTCISGTLDGLEDPGLLCDGTHPHEQSVGLDEHGNFRTTALARYPPGLCEFLARCIVRTILRFRADGSGPTGWRRAAEKTVRISHWSRRVIGDGASALAVLNEDVLRGRCVKVTGAQLAGYLHVDDGVILGGGRRRGCTDGMMNRCADALVAAGFTVDDRSADGTVEKIIGYAPQRHPARLGLPGAKAVRLVEALRALARSSPVDVDLLRSVLGVWIWAALLRREMLSLPQVVFAFVDRFAGTFAEWWPSARREVYRMSDVVISLYADIGAPLTPTVFATDAMGSNDFDHGGYGVVAARCAPDVALRCFEEGLAPGYTVCRLDEHFDGLRRPERTIGRTIPFTRVPPDIIAADWVPLLWGRWASSDHITLGEARTVVKLLDLLARDERCHRHRVLSLQDNRPVQGSFAKGRSTAAALNRICRQRASISAAAELQSLLPWVQSKLMPADYLSRLQEQASDCEEFVSKPHNVSAVAGPALRPQG